MGTTADPQLPKTKQFRQLYDFIQRKLGNYEFLKDRTEELEAILEEQQFDREEFGGIKKKYLKLETEAQLLRQDSSHFKEEHNKISE
jgi:hypothetical protein